MVEGEEDGVTGCSAEASTTAPTRDLSAVIDAAGVVPEIASAALSGIEVGPDAVFQVKGEGQDDWLVLARRTRPDVASLRAWKSAARWSITKVGTRYAGIRASGS